MTLGIVRFFTHDADPAEHFAAFAEFLPRIKVDIYACGPAVKVLKARNIDFHECSVDNISAFTEQSLIDEILHTRKLLLIITDLGHLFAAKIHQTAKERNIENLAYYHHLEPYYRGSAVAAEVMRHAVGVIFANTTLIEGPIYEEPGFSLDFTEKETFPLGYYPVHHAQMIKRKRQNEQGRNRKELLGQNGMKDIDQKIILYLGSNTNKYFQKAFPAFMSMLSKTVKKRDLSTIIILFQKDPTNEECSDQRKLTKWSFKHGHLSNAPKIIISPYESYKDALVVADLTAYYRTTDSALISLIVPVIQIAHKEREDLLTRSCLAKSVTTTTAFKKVVKRLTSERLVPIPTNKIHEKLGIQDSWLEKLTEIINNNIAKKKQLMVGLIN